VYELSLNNPPAAFQSEEKMLRSMVLTAVSIEVMGSDAL
jgi:hypothetical protein